MEPNSNSCCSVETFELADIRRRISAPSALPSAENGLIPAQSSGKKSNLSGVSFEDFIKENEVSGKEYFREFWWQKRISLRNLLLFVMTLQFAIVIIVNTYLQMSTGEKSLLNISLMSVEQYSFYCKTLLLSELAARYQEVDVLSREILFQLVPPRDRISVQHLLWAIFQKESNIVSYSLYLSYSDNQIFMVKLLRLLNESQVIPVVGKIGSDNSTLMLYRLRNCVSGDLECDLADQDFPVVSFHNYSVLQRPWWVASQSMAAYHVGVTRTYSFLTSPDYGVSFVMKIPPFGLDISQTAVVGIDLSYSYFSEILLKAVSSVDPNMTERRDIVAFLVVCESSSFPTSSSPVLQEDSGCFVGSSSSIHVHTYADRHCFPVSEVTTKNYGSDAYLIENISLDIISLFHEWSQVPQSYQTVSQDDIAYHLTRIHYHGVDWAVICGVPVNHIRFSNQVHSRIQRSLVVHMVVLAIVFFLSFLAAFFITKDLKTNTKQLRLFSKFYFNHGYVARSPIVEVERVSEALRASRSSLRSFSKYVPASVVRILLDSNSEAVLGGVEMDITVFYSDIAQFTTISELLSSESLNELMCTYLENISQVILHNGGTIDKYIGDAIFAFWNAPTCVADHPLLACDSALRSGKRLNELQKVFAQIGVPSSILPIKARVGINCGPCLVGNFGSQTRFDYTAFGPHVDVSMMLEDLNKAYGTDIIISQYAYERVHHSFLCRPLDIVFLGASETSRIRIYELISYKGEGQGIAQSMTEIYIQAFDTMVIRSQFASAISLFEIYLTWNPLDIATRKHLEMCRKFLALPPSTMDIGFLMAQSNREQEY